MVVYKITNRLNGKIYVGQTRQPIEKRFLQHAHATTPLGAAMRQCGLENFTIEIIEECDTPAQTKAREIFWISVLKCKIPNGYNQSDGGESCAPKIYKPRRFTPTTDTVTIAESLKRFRKTFNLSQREVAEVWGVTPQAYQIYERDVIPSAEVLKKIAVAFNVSMDYLVGLSDEPRPTPPKADDEELIDALVAYHRAINTALKNRGVEL